MATTQVLGPASERSASSAHIGAIQCFGEPRQTPKPRGPYPPRADSPMREERQDVNRSPAGATVSHGQVGPNDSAAGGFTAVNGDPSKQAAYRHEKAPQRISSTVEGFQDVPREGPRLQTWAPYAEHRAELVDDYSACHIGRPRDRSVGSPKRNREETVDEAQSYAKYSNDDERPAKQRRTHAVDSAVDPYPSDRMLPDLQKGSAAAPSTAGGPSR